MTKLEAHREFFQSNHGRGPLLRLEDLDVADYELLNKDFLVRAKGSTEPSLDSIYAVYLQVLTSWGVICPHPLGYRTFNDKGTSWYGCSLCQTVVLNP